MEEGHQFCPLLVETFGLRQDDEIALETFPLKVAQRNRIADAAIEENLLFVSAVSVLEFEFDLYKHNLFGVYSSDFLFG